MGKYLKLLTVLVWVVLVACGVDDEAGVQTGEHANQLADLVERMPIVSSDVTAEALAAVPEGAVAIPLSELHEHDLAILFDAEGWQLCHLKETCTMNISSIDIDGPSIHIQENVLHFKVSMDEARELIFLVSSGTATCWVNDDQSLLICDNYHEGEEILGTLGGFDLSRMEEAHVHLNEETIFEMAHNDGVAITRREIIARNDFETFIESGNTSFSLFIRHEKIAGYLTATHVQIMVFP